MFGIGIGLVVIAARVGAVVIAAFVGLGIVMIPDLIKLYRIRRM